MAKFELYKDAKSEYRWRLRSANGQIIATGGEGYTSRAAAVKGIEAVKRDAGGATVAEIEAVKRGGAGTAEATKAVKQGATTAASVDVIEPLNPDASGATVEERL